MPRSLDTPHSGVVHVLHALDRGGAELRTVDLVQRTHARFDFLLLKSRMGAIESEIRDSGHGIAKIPLRVRNFPRYFTFFRARHRRIVHVHDGAASGPVLLLAAVAGVRVRIVHFRSDAVGGANRPLKSFYLMLSRRLVRMLATHIIGVSPGSLTNGWRPDWQSDHRCQVIPNGFDACVIRDRSTLPRELSRTEGVLTVVFVGRRDPAKNQARALEIWARLARSHRARLLMVGKHDRALELEAERLNAGCPPGSVVELVGEVPDVRPFFAVSDVMLITSRREGLPGAMLEGLAFGLPVVSSELPGTTWIAEKIEGVALLSLDRPDDEWVSTLVEHSKWDVQSIRDSFDRSEFQIQEALARFGELWSTRDASTK